MYNSTTHSFTLADATGTFDWIIEGLDAAEFAGNSDTDLYEWVDVLISNTIEQDDYDIEVRADDLDYPVYGYTTDQQYADQGEYIEAKSQELREDLHNERDAVVEFLRQWIATA